MDAENRFAHNFSQPFQFSCVVDYRTFEENPAPTLLLEIFSLDWWDLNRIEGYGVMQLPICAGSHSLNAATWRPKGSIADELRRYFLGTSIALTDIRKLKNGSNGFENRTGWCGVSTGFVEIICNTVVINPGKEKRANRNKRRIQAMLNPNATQALERVEKIKRKANEVAVLKSFHARINRHFLKCFKKICLRVT